MADVFSTARFSRLGITSLLTDRAGMRTGRGWVELRSFTAKALRTLRREVKTAPED